MSTTNPKEVISSSLATIAQAIGHAHRLELLQHLAQGRRSVEDLAARSGLTFANTSRHLQILRRARLVETTRQGKRILYSLAGEAEIVALLGALGRVGERNLAEMRQVMDDYLTARDRLAPVTRAELLGALRDDAVTLLDVRSADEFALGHLPGAQSLPLDELEQHLEGLPKGGIIVAYCRGPYCVLSAEAVAMLRARGFDARRLEEGFPEWKAAGLAVEASA